MKIFTIAKGSTGFDGLKRGEREHGFAGLQAARAVHQRIPHRHAGAGQRGGFLERQVSGQPQQAIGRKHGVLGQAAVERKA